VATEIRSPVSPQALDAALAEFSDVLGAARVITDADGLRAFRDPFQFATWEDNTASAVLSPTTVEEIQEIVRIACPCGLMGRDATTATAVRRRACAGR
jgi:4-cresol dehydrogenase (hydroxylating)